MSGAGFLCGSEKNTRLLFCEVAVWIEEWVKKTTVEGKSENHIKNSVKKPPSTKKALNEKR